MIAIFEPACNCADLKCFIMLFVSLANEMISIEH
jgi:hypothetical protein